MTARKQEREKVAKERKMCLLKGMKNQGVPLRVGLPYLVDGSSAVL
jgi:hypothetical protein